MQSDARFSSSIVVPKVSISGEESESLFRETTEYLAYKGFDFKTPSPEGHFAQSDLESDVVFFSNPHPIVDKRFRSDLFENKLGCYVPYSMDIFNYGANQTQYNQDFHQQMWRVYVPHREDLKRFAEINAFGASNVRVSGFPDAPRQNFHLDRFLSRQGKKIVMWAPHHSIDRPDFPLASFLQFAEPMKELVGEFKSSVDWVFRPHPLLRNALVKNPDWGRVKTDKYFSWWESNSIRNELPQSPFEALEGVDAVIHDSGSFTAEAILAGLPSMFLSVRDDIGSYFSDLGNKALSAHQSGSSTTDIRDFLDSLSRPKQQGALQRTEFQNLYFSSTPPNPASFILDDIYNSIRARF